MPRLFSSPTDTPQYPLLTLSLLALAVFAFAAAWLVVAATTGGRAGWMVLVAALNAIAWLRVTHTPKGASRGFLAVLAASASIALGEWLVASLPIASAMNQLPLETAHRIGPDFDWMLIRLGNTPLDWLTVIVALTLAAWFGR